MTEEEGFAFRPHLDILNRLEDDDPIFWFHLSMNYLLHPLAHRVDVADDLIHQWIVDDPDWIPLEERERQ